MGSGYTWEESNVLSIVDRRLLGEAHLYPFTATITMNGKIADTETTHIGIRSLRVVRDKDEAGTTFYFELNGKPLFWGYRIPFSFLP